MTTSPSPIRQLHPEPDVRVERITPTAAKEYLAQNTHNRNIRGRVVDAYTEDILNGDWAWNGESIKFATDGTLLDGQHRLAAIVKAGRSVRMLVVRGLPEATQETMDAGAKRKFADALKLRGETHNIVLAAILRAVTLWESGKEFTGTVSHSQMSRTLARYPDLRDICPTLGRLASTARMPSSVGGLAWHLFSQIDADDAIYFFDRLASDQDHHSGEPIYALRRALGVNQTVRGERSTRFLLAITIKAWNKYRLGEPCQALGFRSGGSRPEPFPEPK